MAESKAKSNKTTKSSKTTKSAKTTTKSKAVAKNDTAKKIKGTRKKRKVVVKNEEAEEAKMNVRIPTFGMRRRTVLGILTLIFLIVMGVGGTLLALSVSTGAPYNIDSSKISADYLKTRSDLGVYKLLQGDNLPIDNPVEDGTGAVTAYYNEDGVYSETDLDFSVIAVINDTTAIDQIVGQLAASGTCPEANPSVTQSGDIRYFKAICETQSVYAYATEAETILFITPDGANALDQMIANY